jgi:hypothetical protein
VVVQVLVAERQAVDALRDQRLDLMHDEVAIATVANTARHPPGQPDGAIRFPQRQRSAVRGDGAAVETAHNLTALEAFKVELCRATVCRHRSAPVISAK